MSIKQQTHRVTDIRFEGDSFSFRVTGPPIPSELQTLLHEMGLLRTGQIVTGISGTPGRIEFVLSELPNTNSVL
jgi:hypothetical protein